MINTAHKTENDFNSILWNEHLLLKLEIIAKRHRNSVRRLFFIHNIILARLLDRTSEAFKTILSTRDKFP